MRRITLLLFLFLAAACSRGDAPVGPEPVREAPPVDQPAPSSDLVSDRAVVIDPDQLALLSDSVELSKGIFRYEVLSPEAPRLDVGHYLVGPVDSERDDFYIRRVTEISWDADARVVTIGTVEAFWREVIRSGRYQFSLPLDGSGWEESPSPAVSLSAVPIGGTGIDFDFDYDLCQPLGEIFPNLPEALASSTLCDRLEKCWDGSAASVIDFEICAAITELQTKGSVSLSGNLDFQIVIDTEGVKPIVREVSLVGSPEIETDLLFLISAMGSLELGMTAPQLGKTFRKRIFNGLMDIELKVGLFLTIGAETCDATAIVTHHFDGRVGFSTGWVRDRGFIRDFDFENARQSTTDVTFERPDCLETKITVGPKFELKAGFLCGGTKFDPNRSKECGGVGSGSRQKFFQGGAGFEIFAGIGAQDVWGRPVTCKLNNVDIDDCELDTWRHDIDAVADFGAGMEVFFAIGSCPTSNPKDTFKCEVKDFALPPVEKTWVLYDILGLGSLDLYGRGDAQVEVLVTEPNGKPEEDFEGFPRDGGAVWLTRLNPSIDPPGVANIEKISITGAKAPFSLASEANVDLQLPSGRGLATPLCKVNRLLPNTSKVVDCQLTAGVDHALWLLGVAENCFVEDALLGDVDSNLPGRNFFKVVQLRPDEGLPETLSVICEEQAILFGSLRIHATTRGPQPDPDGYSILEGGTFLGSVDSNGTTLIAGLREGDRTITLGDIASDCSVEDALDDMEEPIPGNPRNVTILDGETVDVSFSVVCVDPTVLGQLKVTANTVGRDMPSEYVVEIEQAQYVVSSNGSVTAPVPQGPTEVRLIDVAANCLVAPPNPRTVTVSGETTVETVFNVDCKNSNAATRTSVSGSIAVTGVDSPGTRRGNSPNGQHVDNEVLAVVFDGGITASGTVTRSHNIQAGKGSVSGSIQLDATFNGVSGTVVGTFAGNVKDRAGEFSWAGKGDGELEGLLFKIEFAGPTDGPYSYSGEVLNPNKQGSP